MAFDATGFAQEFGAQVRAVRKYEKITQMELAWMVGLSDKTIRDIERGLPGPSIGAVSYTHLAPHARGSGRGCG